MATERLEFISQPSNGLVFFLQGFGLKNRLPLGLGQIITTLVGDLVHRARRTWLNPITLKRIPLAPHHVVPPSGEEITHLDLPLAAWVTRELRALGFLAERRRRRADEP